MLVRGDEFEVNSVIARRVHAGDSAVPGPRGTLVDLSGASPRFKCHPAGVPFEVPGEGVWWLVNRGEYELEFGLGGLVRYSDARVPDRDFELGFASSLRMFVAHIHGFQSWLKQDEEVTCRVLTQRMRGLLQGAVGDEVRRILPHGCPYGQCLAARAQLEQAIGHRLFGLLYENGVCVIPGTYRINRFTQPYIQI